MSEKFDKLLKRISAAEANKQQWDDHLRQCYRFAMPERNTIDKWNPGQKKNEYLFDSTAPDALEDFAGRMELELVPPNINWMKLEAGTDVPEEEQDKVDEYLEETTDIVFQHINSSNFSSQIHEAFLDLGISTGAVIVEAGDGIQSSLNYRCVSLSELLLEQTSKGLIENVYRKFKIPAGDITDIYPRAKLTERLKQIITEKPTTEVSLIEGVQQTGNKQFDSFVIYPEESHYLIDETLESNPWVVFRESTIPGEVYGRGRVMRALPDIKTLNLEVHDYLVSMKWWASPTFTVTDDGVINPYNFGLTPGTTNAVGSNDSSNPTLRALETGGAPQLLIQHINYLQDNIRRIMISKPYGNIEDTPVRTATEMAIRNADTAKTSLGASGRIQNELMERLIARSVYVLEKQGKIATFRVDGKEVKIKFTSPSSRAQDEGQLAAMTRYMEIMQMLPPELVNAEIRIEDFPTEILDIMGLPATLKRSDEEKAARAQAQAEAQAQAQAIAEEQVAQQQGGAQ